MKQWAREQGSHCALAATTGIGSVNLGEGTTINSLLGYFDTNSLEEHFLAGYLQARMRRLMVAGLEHIIIDEVSMMPAEQITLLVRAVREVNDSVGVMRGDMPPLHMTFVGDFCQLAPVGDKPQGKRKREPAKFAFQSPEWDAEVAQHTRILSKIWRQTNLEFVGALQALRRGEATLMEQLTALYWESKTNMDFPGATIFATNEVVNRYNTFRHDQLTGRLCSFPSRRGDKQRSEWDKEVPQVLSIKEGALVMILANERQDEEDPFSPLVYSNGDLGLLVEAVSESAAVVQLLRTGEEVYVRRVRRTIEEPTGATGSRKEAYRTIGWCEYMPLRLAWGSTCHKSQGLTLDQVQINLRDGFWKTPGMCYVGLSRCRSFEGLRLVGQPGDLQRLATIDPRVRPYA